MSNTQYVHSLERIEHLMSRDGGTSNWNTCRDMLDRIMRICGPCRNRKSFPCLQDQAIIITLLNIALSNPEARIYLLPHLTVILDNVSDFINRSLVGDREFIVQYFNKMVKLQCCVREILDTVSQFYSENDDVFSAEVYYGVINLIANQAGASNTLGRDSVREIVTMISDVTR